MNYVYKAVVLNKSYNISLLLLAIIYTLLLLSFILLIY
jgi:hypothetical protein